MNFISRHPLEIEISKDVNDCILLNMNSNMSNLPSPLNRLPMRTRE